MDEHLPTNTDSDTPIEPEPTNESEERELVLRYVLARYSGPIPPPDLLREYDELIPGAAERILAQAEKQTEHRICLEKTIVESDVRRSRVGLWCGFILALTTIIGGCILVGLGHDGAGATIATGTVVALASVFVYGTAQRRREFQEKALQVRPPDAPE